MSTKEKVEQYIKYLGEGAPEFFGKPKATVLMWLKTGSIPGTAYEKVLDAIASEEPLDGTVNMEQEPVYDGPPPEPPSDWKLQVENWINQADVLIKDLHNRLSFLEGNGPSGQQFNPPPAQRGAGQQVFEPAPRDSNVGSMTRPGGTVLGTFATPKAQQNPNGPKPSDAWLKPRPLRTVVSQ